MLGIYCQNVWAWYEILSFTFSSEYVTWKRNDQLISASRVQYLRGKQSLRYTKSELDIQATEDLNKSVFTCSAAGYKEEFTLYVQGNFIQDSFSFNEMEKLVKKTCR